MNELLLLAPLYLEVNNLRIFEPFFFYFCQRPILVQHEERSKKKEKLSRFFLFSLALENGIPLKGCWMAGLSVSIVICSSRHYDRYMASTTLYNSSLLLYVVWLFFLSPSFIFSPPVSFRPENGPHSLPDTFFFTLKGGCALANNKRSTSSISFFNEAIHCCCIQGQVYNPSTHTHTPKCV